MNSDLVYLALATAITGLLWLPYVINRAMVWGLADTVGYPDHPKPLSPWAERLKRAHANAVENLAIFAPLVLTAHAMGFSNATTQAAAGAYVVGRVIHAAAYAAKLPWIRTVGFTIGWLACAVIAWQILVR